MMVFGREHRVAANQMALSLSQKLAETLSKIFLPVERLPTGITLLLPKREG